MARKETEEKCFSNLADENAEFIEDIENDVPTVAHHDNCLWQYLPAG